MTDSFNLKGFDSVFSSSTNNELQDNLIEFFDWGLLKKGNYFNVDLNEQSMDGEDYSKLRMSDNPHFSAGKAWEGFRKNWIWQSGITSSAGDPAPLVGTDPLIPGISGVYVDSTFYPSDTTGAYAHKVDYFNGRVVFDNPIPTGSLVQAEFSYRYINVVYANNLPFIRELQYRSLEDAEPNEDLVPAEMRVQLPAIAIEIVPRRTFKGYAIGGGQYVYTDVLFHCLAENEFTRNQLVDIVSFQNDKTVVLFDSNSIAKSGDFPIDSYGYPLPSALRYPDLVTKHRGNRVFLQNNIVTSMNTINTNFYAATVRTTAELVKASI